MDTTQDKTSPTISVDGRTIGKDFPTYFIADIAANHNGDLSEAKDLIELAAIAGANAAKFQHFQAENIVSSHGFDSMSNQLSHQANWGKSVTQVYKEATVPWEWSDELKQYCDTVGIHFFSAPYDFGAIEMLDNYVPAYKIGSGDINWYESLDRIASKNKPIFLATGASTMVEVEQAIERIFKTNSQLCLMQCNTNYTGSIENFNHIHLNVLKTFAVKFPQTVLGLSDHTPGHATVLGAVALGARAIEKHFTRHREQVGPDHAFSMNPTDWREMVDRTRELELALGSYEKVVAHNELETVNIQRRCCRAAKDLTAGQILSRDTIDVLRPVESNSIPPSEIENIVGTTVKFDIVKGKALCWDLLQI
jgi:sialic acid synthase SpsE